MFGTGPRRAMFQPTIPQARERAAFEQRHQE